MDLLLTRWLKEQFKAQASRLKLFAPTQHIQFSLWASASSGLPRCTRGRAIVSSWWLSDCIAFAWGILCTISCTHIFVLCPIPLSRSWPKMLEGLSWTGRRAGRGLAARLGRVLSRRLDKNRGLRRILGSNLRMRRRTRIIRTRQLL